MRKVGTSGYTYFWNPGKPSPFEWYVAQGFRTVEINASFYRFPQRSWISAWMRKSPEYFDFSIKVHQSITHRSRLGPGAMKLWERFSKTLKPLEEKIAFYLFQFPSSFKATEENLRRIRSFAENLEPGKIVFEFRHPDWWRRVEDVNDLGVIFCSVDAPELPRRIISSNGVIYLRMHGRTEWYSYFYTDEELEEIAGKLLSSGAEKIYVYFNNDHGMLENALKLKQMIED